jgi:hypothetical protein
VCWDIDSTNPDRQWMLASPAILYMSVATRMRFCFVTSVSMATVPTAVRIQKMVALHRRLAGYVHAALGSKPLISGVSWMQQITLHH